MSLHFCYSCTTCFHDYQSYSNHSCLAQSQQGYQDPNKSAYFLDIERMIDNLRIQIDHQHMEVMALLTRIINGEK